MRKESLNALLSSLLVNQSVIFACKPIIYIILACAKSTDRVVAREERLASAL
jgi:hypothetical protein